MRPFWSTGTPAPVWRHHFGAWLFGRFGRPGTPASGWGVWYGICGGGRWGVGWWVSAPGAILAILTCIGVLDVDDNRHVFLTRQFIFFRPVVYRRVEGGEGRANSFLPKRRGLLCAAGFFPSAGLGAFACAGIRAWCVEGWLCLARRWGWGLGWWGQ